MKVAYIDTSCLVALAFEERSSQAVRVELTACDHWVSSTLLEAELRGAFARERKEANEAELYLRHIDWILPPRRLTAEIDQALQQGTLRGADLWHVACALHAAAFPEEVLFASLDKRQTAVAKKLGFQVFDTKT